MSQVSQPERGLQSEPASGPTRLSEPPRNRLAELWSIPATRALVALLFVLLLGWVFNAHGAFFKLGTHRDALRQASVFGILACGLTLVIISGGIDLAVGSVLALVAVRLSFFSTHL